jgi:SAM-dependent methyltransferase
MTEEVNYRTECPFCGSGRAAHGTLPPDRLSPGDRGIPLVACTGCGTMESILAEPPVADRDEPEGYLPHETPRGLSGWLTNRSQDRKAALVTPWYSSGTVLDIGCGSGGFLAAWLRGRPHDAVAGLEPSPGAAETARARGLNVIDGDLSGPLPEEASGARIYTLWHVLEHVPDPVAALGMIRDAMASDGRIVLVVPNVSALERSVFGSHTIAWDPPRHRWHFTPEGLTALTHKTQLRVLDRFNLVSDDVYDAVGSIRWTLYSRSWVETGSLRERLATGLAVLGGVPLGLCLASLAPWRQRASLGLVLARS